MRGGASWPASGRTRSRSLIRLPIPTNPEVRNKWHTREAEIAAEQAAIADKAP
jgi:hypothetical protein